MNEDFLIYLWRYQLINSDLHTTDGEKIVVQNPGLLNTDSGPDFFNGQVKIDDTTWAGNIEIHVSSSDWFKHKHQYDNAYDNIILHIVLLDDKPVYRNNGEKIPTIELKNNFDEKILSKYRSFLDSTRWIACENLIANVGHFEKYAWLDTLMAERLEQKATAIQEELSATNQDFQEVFYRKLARNFGFKTNADAFESVASGLPLSLLIKHKTDIFQIEALVFGQSGLLHNQLKDDYPRNLKTEYLFLSEKYDLEPIDARRWKFMRMRPSNFPTIRLAQFAQVIYKSSGLLNQILEAGKLNDLITLFKTETSPYWKDHFRFDKLSPEKTKTLGIASIHLILINTIIPFLFVYGNQKNDKKLQQKAIDWLEEVKAERNTITQKFADIGLQAKNAMHSQALIQLKINYCDEKRCLDCRIGHTLLKSV